MTTDPTILLDAFQQKPAAAMEYLRRKGLTFSWNWLDTWREAHAKAFTVAKVVKLDILRDIRAMVDKAIADGVTLAQFKKELTPRLQKAGWWGKKEIINEETGEITEYTAGTPRRLKTIYETNLQTAYMAGRYKGQMDAAADLPYLQYIAVMDGRTTDTCRDMHLRVFRADDPVWDAMYPPNHWGCRARVRSLSERQLQRMGLTPESSKGRLVEKEVVVGKGDRARKETVTGLKLGNGKVFWTGAGWDYNPGKEAWKPDLSGYNRHDVEAYQREMAEFLEKDLTASQKLSKIYLAGIQTGNSLGAAAAPIWVHFGGGAYYPVFEGTGITHVEAFAGKGTNKKFRDALYLAKKYGGKAHDWRKMKGYAVINYNGVPKPAEVHWVHAHGIGNKAHKFIRWMP